MDENIKLIGTKVPKKHFDNMIKDIMHLVHPDIKTSKETKEILNLVIGNILVKLVNSYMIGKNLKNTVSSVAVGQLAIGAIKQGEKTAHIRNSDVVESRIFGVVKKFILLKFPFISLTEQEYLSFTRIISYLIAEVLELSGNAAKDNNRKTVIPWFIYLSIFEDEELDQVIDIWFHNLESEVRKQFRSFLPRRFELLYRMTLQQIPGNRSVVISEALGIDQKTPAVNWKMLDPLTVSKLKTIATEMNIPGRSNLKTKRDLYEAVYNLPIPPDKIIYQPDSPMIKLRDRIANEKWNKRKAAATNITSPTTTTTKTRAEYLFNIAKIAVSYGFVPIPVRGKIPTIPKWNLTRIDPKDPEKVARRVKHLTETKRSPANNVAILCGEASNIVVFDIDNVVSATSNINGIRYWNQLITLNNKQNPREPLPETFTVMTPSNGFHVYFQYDERMPVLSNSNGVMGQKIDFRTNGGLVMFPGSKNFTTGKVYAVYSGFKNNRPIIARMPTWLYNFIVMHQQKMSRK